MNKDRKKMKRMRAAIKWNKTPGLTNREKVEMRLQRFLRQNRDWELKDHIVTLVSVVAEDGYIGGDGRRYDYAFRNRNGELIGRYTSSLHTGIIGRVPREATMLAHQQIDKAKNWRNHGGEDCLIGFFDPGIKMEINTARGYAELV